jgi:hypothetical protein
MSYVPAVLVTPLGCTAHVAFCSFCIKRSPPRRASGAPVLGPRYFAGVIGAAAGAGAGLPWARFSATRSAVRRAANRRWSVARRPRLAWRWLAGFGPSGATPCAPTGLAASAGCFRRLETTFRGVSNAPHTVPLPGWRRGEGTELLDLSLGVRSQELVHGATSFHTEIEMRSGERVGVVWGAWARWTRDFVWG